MAKDILRFPSSVGEQIPGSIKSSERISDEGNQVQTLDPGRDFFPTSRFLVDLTKEHLVFSAGHFITFAGNICERLHGHNWRVSVQVTGPLDENQYVFDFIALRDGTARIVAELDHRMLLPTQHPTIQVTLLGDEVEARYETRRWIFPREDCVLLPIPNTTAERIAEWLGQRLLCDIFKPSKLPITGLKVGIEENFGQWAYAEWDL